MKNFLNRYDFEYFEKDIFNYVDIEYLERLTSLSIGLTDFDLTTKKLNLETLRNEKIITDYQNFSIENDALNLNYTITSPQNFKITLKKNNDVIIETTKSLINIYLNKFAKENLTLEILGATINKVSEFNSQANLLIIYRTFEILFSGYQFKNQDIWFLKSETYKKNFYELFSKATNEFNLKIKELTR